MHVRRQIRDRVAELLGNLPTTGANVFIGRTRALAKDHPPTLLIYARHEQSGRDTMERPAKMMRPLVLVVHGKVSLSEPPDDTLDQIAVEVERVMAADRKMGGLSIDCVLESTEIVAEAVGNSHIGEIAMGYAIRYRTTETDPEMTA